MIKNADPRDNSVPQFTGTNDGSATDTQTGFQLCRASIGSLPDTVSPLKYNPNNIRAGIFHIGAGNFFFAHLGSFIHELLPRDPNWGIVATSIRKDRIISGLNKQDGAYVLVVRENGDSRPEVLAPIVESMFGPADPAAFAWRLANPDIKLVTITVSNVGYCLKKSAPELDLEHPEVLHDIIEPGNPKSLYGFLAAGLRLRRLSGAPLTVMSLDNVEQNSATFKQALLRFLQQTDPELVGWVEEHVDFPVTLVDRITPEMDLGFRMQMKEELGFDSRVMVRTEAYRELVVEHSRFTVPDWQSIGVKVVSDCKPYWERKFYLVNAGHQVPAICGLRLSATHIHEAMSHSAVARLLARAHKEWISILAGDPEELRSYAAAVRRRFADEALNDTVHRVVARTTSKVSERLLASYELGRLRTGKYLKVPAFLTALWMLNLGREDEFGEHIALHDADAEKLHTVHDELIIWLRSVDDDVDYRKLTSKPRHLLRAVTHAVKNARFARLSTDLHFARDLTWSLIKIHRLGVEKAIDALLAR